MKKNKEIYLNKDLISVNVECYSFFDKKSKKYIAFCPALNISDYASSEEDARNGLDILINDAIEFAGNKGNEVAWLLSLGWKVQTQPVMEFEPPNESFLKALSSEFNKLIGTDKVKQSSREIQFA